MKRFVSRCIGYMLGGIVGTVGVLASAWAQQPPGVTRDEIVLGSVIDLSGPASGVGLPERQGMDLAVDLINESGGVHGRRLRLIVEDSVYDPKKAVLGTQKLLGRDKVFAIVGQLGVAITQATMPMVLDNGTPMLFPGAPLEAVWNPPKRLAFAASMSYKQQMEYGARYAYETLGKRRFCMLYQDDESGFQMLGGVEAELAKLGSAMTEKVSYKRGAVDFSAQFARMRGAGCDVVMLGTILREAAAAAKERARIGWEVPMVAGQGAVSMALFKLAGSTAEGMYTVSQILPMSIVKEQPRGAEIVRRFRAKYGVQTDPDEFVLFGYGIVMAFAEGARLAGPELTVDSLVSGLEQLRDFNPGAGMGAMSFAPGQRFGSREMFLLQARDGNWVKVGESK